MDPQRFMLGWEPRADRLETNAEQLRAAMDWLRTVPSLGGSWTSVHRKTLAPMDCNDAVQARGCIEAGAYPIAQTTPPSEPEAYKQYFYSPSVKAWTARISYVCGVRTVMHGIETPNGFDLQARLEGDVRTNRQILVGLIGIFKPVWAFVAPVTLVPRETGRPPVGHLTYLSSWFGPAPSLPPSVLVSPIKNLGTIVQAFEDPLDGSKQAHRDAVAALERALVESSWLRPFSNARLSGR